MPVAFVGLSRYSSTSISANALYLPNVLSLRNAKIEIHPTKDSAVQLHRTRARVYSSSRARASDSDAPVQSGLRLL